MNTRPEHERVLTLIAIALTFGSGAADVITFTRLGSVFTSVMTGNMVLLGLAVARRSLAVFSYTTVAVAGYIAGVAASTLLARRVRAGGAARSELGRAEPDAPVQRHIRWMLGAELTLLAGFTVGWEICGASPAGWAQFVLLATLAAAMGTQSAAVNEMGLAHVSTTFLTGTLTGLVSALVSPGKATPYRLRRFGVLIGLAGGASLSGLLISTAADAAPVLSLAAALTTAFLARAAFRIRAFQAAAEEARPDRS
jgi:uncharacterized membrane protein YoaK (UPF0700 family)